MTYEALHLDSDEKIVMEVRKHWIVFLGHAVGLLFVGFLPLIIWALSETFGITFFNSITGNHYTLFTFFYSLWLLTMWISFFIDWTKYYLDVWYVTEKRIIIIDQKGIFDREIANIRFDKVQDITIEVKGLIPTFLKFGTVKVQTASEDNTEFAMTFVRHPDEVRRVVFAQHNEVHDRPEANPQQGSVK